MSYDATAGAPLPDLAPHVLQDIYAHARATYPEECCGFLIGPSDSTTIDEVRRCVNEQNLQHAENPEVYTRTAQTAYFIGARDIHFLAQSLDQSRPVKIIYHSHPDRGAYFSEEDTRVALGPWADIADGPMYPVDYIVIDAQSDHVAGAKLFRWDAGQRSFIEVDAYPDASHL